MLVIAIFSSKFLLILQKKKKKGSLFLCDVWWPRSNPECCIIACCCLTSFMCSLRELYSTVLCYCVIHHTAATCSHFYHWYIVKQLLNKHYHAVKHTTDFQLCWCGFFVLLEIFKLTVSGECSVKAWGVFRLFAAFLISFLVCLMMTGLLSAIKDNNTLNRTGVCDCFSDLFNDFSEIFPCTLYEIMHVDYSVCNRGKRF